MKKKLGIILGLTLILVSTFLSCSGPNVEETTLAHGNWLFELQVDSEDPLRVLPFNVEVLEDHVLVIKNATEEIRVTEVHYSGDSVRFIMPVFGSEFKGKLSGDSLVGTWHKYNVSKDYKIPFVARMNAAERFRTSTDQPNNFAGRWKSFFIDGTDTSEAIGIFAQSGNRVTGTFLTEVGDYRYLEGVSDGNRIKLSTFDGAHAFLFEASANDKGELNGYFRSGNSWQARWLASQDVNAVLSDMRNLTYLKPGYDGLEFSFPDEEGNTISLSDSTFQNKVVIVQLFGTWCPNCMDETRLLVNLHEKYHNAGLEIIGLDFEPKPTPEYFKSRITRFRNDLNVPYTLLLAGHSNKKKAAESLPMLNHILSYPTAIIIDRSGEIREIHTGFTGPGTGGNYQEYSQETEDLIESLLEE